MTVSFACSNFKRRSMTTSASALPALAPPVPALPTIGPGAGALGQPSMWALAASASMSRLDAVARPRGGSGASSGAWVTRSRGGCWPLDIDLNCGPGWADDLDAYTARRPSSSGTPTGALSYIPGSDCDQDSEAAGAISVASGSIVTTAVVAASSLATGTVAGSVARDPRDEGCAASASLAHLDQVVHADAAAARLGRKVASLALRTKRWPPVLGDDEVLDGHQHRFEMRLLSLRPDLEVSEEGTHARLTEAYRSGTLAVRGALPCCLGGRRWDAGWRELQLELTGHTPSPPTLRLTGGLSVGLSHLIPRAKCALVVGPTALESCGFSVSFLPKLLTIWGNAKSENRQRHFTANLHWGDRLRILLKPCGWCEIVGRSDTGAGPQWKLLVGFQTALGEAPVYASLALQHTTTAKLLRVYVGTPEQEADV